MVKGKLIISWTKRNKTESLCNKNKNQKYLKNQPLEFCSRQNYKLCPRVLHAVGMTKKRMEGDLRRWKLKKTFFQK